MKENAVPRGKNITFNIKSIYKNSIIISKKYKLDFRT